MDETNILHLTNNAKSGVSNNATRDAGLVLTRDDVAEFRAIVRNTCGIDFTEQEAWNRAIELVALVRMLVKPYPEDEHGRVQTSSNLPA